MAIAKEGFPVDWLEKLKALKASSRMSIREISRASGLPEPTLEKVFSGQTKNPGIATVRRLVHSLGYTLGDLDMDEVKKNAPSCSEEAAKAAADYSLLDAPGQYTVRAVLDAELKRLGEASPSVPEIQYIRHYFTAAAAGYAAPIEGEDYELVPRDEDTPAKADFSIQIAGDSMEPYIHDGQRVFVQRDESLQEFDVGIFFVDGDVFCKQWCVDYAGTLHLLSANPAREDANIRIDRHSGRSVVCFGKVLLPRKLPRPIYD